MNTDKLLATAAVAPSAAPQNRGRSRAEVHAEAVEAVKRHQSTLASQLELAR